MLLLWSSLTTSVGRTTWENHIIIVVLLGECGVCTWEWIQCLKTPAKKACCPISMVWGRFYHGARIAWVWCGKLLSFWSDEHCLCIFLPLSSAFLSFLINQTFKTVFLNGKSLFLLQVSICLCYDQAALIVTFSSGGTVLPSSLPSLWWALLPPTFTIFHSDKSFAHKKILKICRIIQRIQLRYFTGSS